MKKEAAPFPSGGDNAIARTSGLKFRDYAGYGLIDLAGCLVFALVGSLLQKYYTDILHFSPWWIMIMMIAARIWDAINDPMMGRIADTCAPARSGRYRPWIRRAAFPLALSAVLMFAKWPGLSNNIGLNFAYATFTYVLFGMSYTVLQIPYGTLASVVTTDEGERNKLSVFRSVGACIGNLPVIIIASFCYRDRVVNGVNIIGQNGKVIQDMVYGPVLWGTIIVSIASFLLLNIAYFLNRERVPSAPAPKKEKGAARRAIHTIVSDRGFMALSMASMLLLAGQMFTQSYYLYLFNDFFGKGWMNLVSMLCTYGPVAVLMFFTPALVRRFGKKELCTFGIAVCAFANLALFFLKGLMPDFWWLFLLMCFIGGCGQTFIVLQVWTMVTDSIDNIQVKTGSREDGTAYSVFMFFRKVGQVIAAIAVNGALIGMSYAYEKGAVQSAHTLSVMYDMATIIPALLYGGIALILGLAYPLSKSRVAELQIRKEEYLKSQL